MKYQTKPVLVEAIRFIDNNHSDVVEWIDEMDPESAWNFSKDGVSIKTKNGETILAKSGYWLVYQGGFSVLSAESFSDKYDQVV